MLKKRTSYISSSEHYSKVLSKCKNVSHTLWIGTADIKDLYISNGKTEKLSLGVLSELIGRGVNVRFIHAKKPGKHPEGILTSIRILLQV